MIRVTDTGIGMSRNLLQRIFDPFVQGNEAVDQSEGGMGLGLTLVRSLVEMHNGVIRAHSDGPGKGSEFTVELPLSLPPRDDSAPPKTSDAVEVDTAGLKLLVVEDNKDDRDMMEMLLKSYGYEVIVAGDGLSALTSLELERPDVAFVDIGLPEMDGYEVARRARRRLGADTACLVALTGYGRPADQQKARDAGFDQHLTKPVDMESLCGLVVETKCTREKSNTRRTLG